MLAIEEKQKTFSERKSAKRLWNNYDFAISPWEGDEYFRSMHEINKKPFVGKSSSLQSITKMKNTVPLNHRQSNEVVRLRTIELVPPTQEIGEKNNSIPRKFKEANMIQK